MIKTLIKNDFLGFRYFKNTITGSTSLAKDGGKVYSDLRDGI
jgi:hypothetical protein